MSVSIGIDALSIYTPRFFLPLHVLAKARGVDPDKYSIGLGQDEMTIMPPDEDIVTMGANAAQQIVTPDTIDSIRLLIFATESGVDQSKAAGLWVHSLLGLSKNCRVVEMKQACYSATCALQLAAAYVQGNPKHKALIIASDNARYGLNTPGEPTQGCAAAAFLVSHNPSLISLEPYQGIYSEHIMDFWRPNYLSEAIVDGKYSTRAYLNALVSSWEDYVAQSGHTYSMHSRFCYHLPFTKMAEKAHERLIKLCLPSPEASSLGSSDNHTQKLSPSLLYSRRIGNGYTASLYMGLASLIENDPQDLSQQRIGLFSYGSGCTGEFFSGILQPGYSSVAQASKARHLHMLSSREELSCPEYEKFFTYSLPQDGKEEETPLFTKQGFRLKGVKNHERLYEKRS